MKEVPKSENLIDYTTRTERERIANWLWDRANLIMTNDPAGALELSICSSAIRSNKLGPRGMHGDEPILKEASK
jgi:hypothetical protein